MPAQSSGNEPNLTSSEKRTFTFEVQDYRPDGVFTVTGLLQLITVLAVTAILLGIAAGWVRQYFWLLLIFPILIGVVIASAGNLMIAMLSIRNPRLAAVLGASAGIFAMLVMHFTSYRILENHLAQNVDPRVIAVARNFDQLKNQPDQIVEEIRSTVPNQDQASFQQEIIEYLEQDPLILQTCQVQSFPEFLHLEATWGINIGHQTDGKNELNLGYVGTWIYWLLELVIAAGIPLMRMRKTAAEPYCPVSNQWKNMQVYGPVPGAPEWIEDWKQGRVSEPDWDNHDLQYDLLVTLYTSPEHQQTEPLEVFLERVTTNAKGNVSSKKLAQLTYPGAAAELLQQLLSLPEETAEDRAREAEGELDEEEPLPA